MILKISKIFICFFLYFILPKVKSMTAEELSKTINELYGPRYYLLYDPTNLLSAEEKEEVEKNLYNSFKLSGYYTFCIIVQEITIDNDYSIKDFNYDFIRKLKHPTDFDLTKSISYLFSKNNRKHTLRLGSQANYRISNSRASSILSEGAFYFKSERYNTGIMKVMNLVYEYFDEPDSPLSTSFPKFFMFVGCAIWLLLSIIVIGSYIDKLKEIKKNYFNRMSYKDRKIMNLIMDFYIKVKNGQIKYENYCLICLQKINSFPSISSTEETTNDFNLLIKDPSISICDFHHCLHKTCLENWQKASMKIECPVCLEHVEKISKNDIITAIIRIKGDINPIFRNIDVTNDTWKSKSSPTKLFSLHHDEYESWHEIEMQRIKEERERREKEEEDKKLHPEKYIKPKSPTSPGRYSPDNYSPPSYSPPSYSPPSYSPPSYDYGGYDSGGGGGASGDW